MYRFSRPRDFRSWQRACGTLSAAAPNVVDMQGVQGTLDELGTPLAEVTFVFVDLETTAGSPSGASIPEVGAVTLCGGGGGGEVRPVW